MSFRHAITFALVFMLLGSVVGSHGHASVALHADTQAQAEMSMHSTCGDAHCPVSMSLTCNVAAVSGCSVSFLPAGFAFSDTAPSAGSAWAIAWQMAMLESPVQIDTPPPRA